MNEPRISCILPALEDFEVCVRSIKCFKAQTYANRELIVVDSGVDGLAWHIERMADPMIVRIAAAKSSAMQLYALGVARSTGSLIAAWPEFAYSDPLRLTFQQEIMKGEKTEAAVISSISLAVLGKRKFGYSRQGLWMSTLLAPREKFLNVPQSDLLEDAMDEVPEGIELSMFTAPDLFVAPLPEGDDGFIARRFDGAFEKLDIADVIRIIEKLKYTDHAHSTWPAHDSVFHGHQLWPLDQEKAEKHFAAFMATPVAAEWCAYDVLNNLTFLRQNLNKTDEFLKSVTKLLLMDPSRAEAHNLLGIYYFNQGQPLKAIPFFKAATEATWPVLPYAAHWPYYSWLPYDYMSACYRMTGNIEKAIEMNLKAQKSPDQKERLKAGLSELVNML